MGAIWVSRSVSESSWARWKSDTDTIWYPFCWGLILSVSRIAGKFGGRIFINFASFNSIRFWSFCKISFAAAKTPLIPNLYQFPSHFPHLSQNLWYLFLHLHVCFFRSEADWSKDRLTDVNAQHYKTKMGLTKAVLTPAGIVAAPGLEGRRCVGGLDAWYGCIDGSREKLPGRPEDELMTICCLKWVAKANLALICQSDVCCKMRRLIHVTFASKDILMTFCKVCNTIRWFF